MRISDWSSDVCSSDLIAAAVAIVFVCGIGVGYSAKPAPALALYHGQTDQEAARGLPELALEQAEDGSWERIGVARVYYLGGFKAEGPALFRSEKRRGGNECGKTGRSRVWPCP